jgi:hypothetical protein
MLFAGSEIQLIFDRRVRVDCACFASTPPIHGAEGERSGSDFAVTCTGAHRSRSIACDDPLRGSRCGAGAARSGTTRSFFHFHVSKFVLREPSGGMREAGHRAGICPTLVRLLGCGPVGGFDIPVAFESAADHRPPVARKNWPSAPMEGLDGANDLRIVIGMCERK